MNESISEHSPLPWRSVYPLGSKQRCAAVASNDHYVYLHVAESDALDSNVRMHQANADLIVGSFERSAALEAQLTEAKAKILELANQVCDGVKLYCDRGDVLVALQAQVRQLREENQAAWEAVTKFCNAFEVNAISGYVLERRAALTAMEDKQ